MVGILGWASAVCAADAATTHPSLPFSGAYIHIDRLFEKGMDAAARRKTIIRVLDRFQASGLKVAMPYVTTTSGSACYASRIVPVRVFPDWDPMELFVREAHRRGLEVWPVVCVIPSGDKKLAGILDKHPDWALRDKKGEKLGYLSPCHPESRRYILSVLREIVTMYQPDGLLLDYLRFPSQSIQLDDQSEARFREAYPGYDKADDAAKKQQLQAFKEKALTELAEQISKELRAAKPALRLGLYTWGPQVTRNHNVSQRWDLWIARGYLDMVNVSGYCYPDNYKEKYMQVFEDRMKDAVRVFQESKTSAELTFTLGVVTSHGKVANAEQIGEYLRVARKAGIRGVAVFTWSYLEPYLDDVLKAGYFKEINIP